MPANQRYQINASLLRLRVDEYYVEVEAYISQGQTITMALGKKLLPKNPFEGMPLSLTFFDGEPDPLVETRPLRPDTEELAELRYSIRELMKDDEMDL